VNNFYEKALSKTENRFVEKASQTLTNFFKHPSVDKVPDEGMQK